MGHGFGGTPESFNFRLEKTKFGRGDDQTMEAIQGDDRKRCDGCDEAGQESRSSLRSFLYHIPLPQEFHLPLGPCDPPGQDKKRVT